MKALQAHWEVLKRAWIKLMAKTCEEQSPDDRDTYGTPYIQRHHF